MQASGTGTSSDREGGVIMCVDGAACSRLVLCGGLVASLV